METVPSPDAPENPGTNPEPSTPPAIAVAAPNHDFIYWVKKLLVCNPFYLVSAALLLYGFYLVTTDNNFPGREVAQLGFNFGSLQFYELLLVGTAIVLAHRKIWYDSNLLIFLENLLILVPFILISQAALIDRQVVWTMCAIGGGMAFLRFGGLKRFNRHLNLPRGLLFCGMVLLLVNAALPLIYRTLHESKVGTKPTTGAAFEMNQCSWLILLPGIIALANCLPRPAQIGDLLPQRRWVPTGIFTLWLSGTIVHLYSLGYVYNFDWETSFLIVPLWALAWTIYNRHGDFLRARGWGHALLMPPALITLIAVDQSAYSMFSLLTSLNMLFYLLLFLRQGGNRLVLHLLMGSCVALALGLVKQFDVNLPVGLTVTKCAFACIAMYLAYWIGISRSPKLGVAGAVVVGITTGALIGPQFNGGNLAVQAGFMFLMLHSLLWKDEAHPGAAGARIFACSLWTLHSLIVVLTHSPYSGAMISTMAAVVLSTCGIIKLIRGTWPPLVLPISAGIALLMYPGNLAVIMAQDTPVGLWVIAGSFLLFAIGTVTALTRSKWNPTPAKAAITPTDRTN
jgi:hypothetical protein